MSADHLPLASSTSPPPIVYYDKIIRHLTDPTILSSVREEVRTLGNVLWTFERAFLQISLNLARVDRMFSTNGEPPVIQEYAAEWKGLHKEYKELLSGSQLTANNIKTNLAVFTTVVVPALQSSDSKEVKQQKLDSYIADLTASHKDTKEDDEKFGQLVWDVAGFRKRLRETLSPYHADDISAADWERICEIDAEIKVLQEELDQINGFLRGAKNVVKLGVPESLATTIGTTVAVLAAVTALLALTPAIGAGILAGVLVGAGTYVGVTGYRKHAAQKTDKKQAIQRLVDEQNKLAPDRPAHIDPRVTDVSESFRKLDIDAFQDAIHQMAMIQFIRDLLVIDVQTLRADLDNPAVGETSVFNVKLHSVKAVFGALYCALDEYTLQQRPNTGTQTASTT